LEICSCLLQRYIHTLITITGYRNESGQKQSRCKNLNCKNVLSERCGTFCASLERHLINAEADVQKGRETATWNRQQLRLQLLLWLRLQLQRCLKFAIKSCKAPQLAKTGDGKGKDEVEVMLEGIWLLFCWNREDSASGFTEKSFSRCKNVYIIYMKGNQQKVLQAASNWIESLPQISQKEVYVLWRSTRKQKTNNHKKYVRTDE